MKVRPTYIITITGKSPPRFTVC